MFRRVLLTVCAKNINTEMNTLTLTVGRTYISRAGTNWKIIGRYYCNDIFIGINQTTGQEAFFSPDGRRWFRPESDEDLVVEVNARTLRGDLLELRNEISSRLHWNKDTTSVQDALTDILADINTILDNHNK